MLRSLRKRLVGAALSLVALLGAAAPAAAEPALWALRDADSTVYLFGTVHALKPDLTWRTPEFEAALASASELWIEVDTGDAAAIQALVVRLGASPNAPLSSRLTAQERAQLAAAAGSVGMPPAAFEAMRPWLAAITLAVAPMLKAGYDPESGVDTVLEASARAAGKPVRTFETMEQQIRFFADLPAEQELDFLRSTLEQAEEPVAVIDQLTTAWAQGDIGALETEMIEEMRRDDRLLYDLLLTRRNIAWAERIKTMMQGAGTHFIAVGAGHLVGPDSVQAQLRKLGLNASRQ